MAVSHHNPAFQPPGVDDAERPASSSLDFACIYSFRRYSPNSANLDPPPLPPLLVIKSLLPVSFSTIEIFSQAFEKGILGDFEAANSDPFSLTSIRYRY